MRGDSMRLNMKVLQGLYATVRNTIIMALTKHTHLAPRDIAKLWGWLSIGSMTATEVAKATALS